MSTKCNTDYRITCILQCARISYIQINLSFLHLQETIVKKFHNRHLHQNHDKKNRDRNRMYVSIFLHYKQSCFMHNLNFIALMCMGSLLSVDFHVPVYIRA